MVAQGMATKYSQGMATKYSQGMATRYSLTADRLAAAAAQSMHDTGMAAKMNLSSSFSGPDGGDGVLLDLMAKNLDHRDMVPLHGEVEEDPLKHTSAEDESDVDLVPLPSSSKGMSLTARRKEMAEEDTSDEDEDGHRRTKRGEADGGVGGCIMLFSGGRRRAFHDGCGLSSA